MKIYHDIDGQLGAIWTSESFEELYEITESYDCNRIILADDAEEYRTLYYLDRFYNEPQWTRTYLSPHRHTVTFYNRVLNKYLRLWQVPTCVCSICGEMAFEDNLIGLGWASFRNHEGYCPKCMADPTIMIECTNCRDTHPITDLYKIYGVHPHHWGLACQKCVDKFTEFHNCSECGRLVHDNYLYYTYDDNIVCGRCYEDHYFTCDRCDNVFHINERHTHDSNWYCDNCITEVQEEEGEAEECDYEGVYSYHNYPSGYNPKRCKNDPDPLYMGVELEVDGGSFDYDDFKEDDYLYHFEHDGSLSNRGVELITQPCTLKYHQLYMDWESICKRLISQGYKSHNTSCCGLHVHLSRDAMTPAAIVKMDVIINRNGWFFGAIGRRNAFYGNGESDGANFEACRKPAIWTGYSHEKYYASRSEGYTPKNIILNKYCWDNHRYTAVNVLNERTIELRFAKGTLKHTTILCTLEVYHAIAKFCENAPFRKVYDKDIIKEFVEYIHKNRKLYKNALPVIKELMKRVNTDECNGVIDLIEKLTAKKEKETK